MANPPDVQTALEWGMRHTLLQPLPADQAALARRRAAAPLKPAKPQQPCDVGLFSDVAAQTDLLDMARKS